MPEYFKLDKIIAQGTTYETPPDRGYIVEAIGTGASSTTKLLVDGSPVIAVVNTLSPLTANSGNTFGPIELGEYYVVIPPNTKFSVDGPSGATIRLIGKIVHILPGEAFPPDLKARYNEQTKKYVTYIEGSYSFSAGASWATGQEITLVELTPKTIEKYRLDDRIGVSISGTASAIGVGQIGIRFYLDGKPLDILTQDAGPYGLDAAVMPLPPTTTAVIKGYTMKEIPIEVLGDHTIKITAINVSGSDLTAASSTTSISVTLKAIAKYERTS